VGPSLVQCLAHVSKRITFVINKDSFVLISVIMDDDVALSGSSPCS